MQLSPFRQALWPVFEYLVLFIQITSQKKKISKTGNKNFSPIGPAVWTAMHNICMNVLFYYISNYREKKTVPVTTGFLIIFVQSYSPPIPTSVN